MTQNLMLPGRQKKKHRQLSILPSRQLMIPSGKALRSLKRLRLMPTSRARL